MIIYHFPVSPTSFSSMYQVTPSHLVSSVDVCLHLIVIYFYINLFIVHLC